MGGGGGGGGGEGASDRSEQTVQTIPGCSFFLKNSVLLFLFFFQFLVIQDLYQRLTL